MSQNIALAKKHTEAIESIITELLQVDEKLRPHVIKALRSYLKMSPDEALMPPTLALRSGYLMASDYYTGVVRGVMRDLALSAGNNSRTLIEIFADMNHIYRDSSKLEERAKKYCDDIFAYSRAIRKSYADIMTGKKVRLENTYNWTSSNIEQRVGALGFNLLRHYDFFSCLTHANPMGTALLQIPPLKATTKMTALSSALHSMWALTQMTVIHNGNVGVSEEELATVLAELNAIDLTTGISDTAP